MARTYRRSYARTQMTLAPEWKRRADGPGDTTVKSWHIKPIKAAERTAVRNLLSKGLEPEPTKWMQWWQFPPTPRAVES